MVGGYIRVEVCFSANLVHGDSNLDRGVDLAVLHQVPPCFFLHADVFCQVQSDGPELHTLFTAGMLLVDDKHKVLLLKHIIPSDGKAQVDDLVGVTPTNLVVFDWFEMCPSARIAATGPLDEPFDVGLSGDKGNVVKVDDLEPRGRQ